MNRMNFQQQREHFSSLPWLLACSQHILTIPSPRLLLPCLPHNPLAERLQGLISRTRVKQVLGLNLPSLPSPVLQQVAQLVPNLMAIRNGQRAAEKCQKRPPWILFRVFSLQESWAIASVRPHQREKTGKSTNSSQTSTWLHAAYDSVDWWKVIHSSGDPQPTKRLGLDMEHWPDKNMHRSYAKNPCLWWCSPVWRPMDTKHPSSLLKSDKNQPDRVFGFVEW